MRKQIDLPQKKKNHKNNIKKKIDIIIVFTYKGLFSTSYFRE